MNLSSNICKEERLIDRIEYYLAHPEDTEYVEAKFTAGERDILHAIRTYEQNRYMIKWKEINSQDKEKVAEELLLSMSAEKEISFLLKELVDAQINFLLRQKKPEAWMEILTWYQILDGKGIIADRFWEFSVLRTMLDAFIEELKLYYGNGSLISVLSIGSMKELTERYFQVVFLLRRIEYDVEPINEVLYQLTENKISLTAVKIILRNARIFHREKVEQALKGWE